MHTANKVLLGVIIFFSLLFFVFASGVLQKQKQFRTELKSLQSNLQATQRQVDALQYGTVAEPGIPQLETELDRQTEGRGHVWYKVTPGQIDPATGAVTVGVETPVPHQLTPEKIIFAFGDRDNGGGYLAEFRVTAAADKQATLAPTAKLTADELARLQKSPGPWTLYDVMPADSHAIFQNLPDDQLKALLPEASLQEYSKDGKPADPNDPADRVMVVAGEQGGEQRNYDRQLRDYVGEFHEYGRQRSIYLDRIAAEQKDKEYLTNQLQRGEATVKFRAVQIDETKKQLATLTQERDDVVAHRKSLDAHLAAVETSINRLAKENHQLADQLSRSQLGTTRPTEGETSASIAN